MVAMLKFLRKKKNIKRIIWALAIVIVPAFVLWGAGSVIRDKNERRYAGIISGKKVSIKDYLTAWQAVKNQAIMTYGEEFRKIAKYLPLEEEAWNRLILLREAKKQRVLVTDEEVVAQIKTYPFFQSNGSFDQTIYATLLRDVFQTTPRDFEQETRENLLISKLARSATAQIRVDENEVKGAYKEENEQAEISYILIKPEEFVSEREIEGKELEEYYQEHSRDFTTRDKVNVQYIAAEYTEQESKKAAEDKIWVIWEELGEGDTLDKLAEKYNLPLKETGYFSEEEQIPDIGWSYPLSQAAFLLSEGEISDVIETPKGYYLLQLRGKKGPYIPRFAEAKEKVALVLRQKMAGELAQKKAEEYYARITEALKTPGSTFEDIAGELSLEIKKSEPFTRRGYIPEIGQAEALSHLFKLKTGEISKPILTPKGYCIVRLDALIPIDEKRFEEEKQEFEKRVAARKKGEYYRGWLQTLRIKSNLQSNLEQSRTQ